MHQSTTPSLSQTIWQRWSSRQFLNLPIVETLLPVTFGDSLRSEAVVMRQFRRWKSLWRRPLTRSHKKSSMGAFQKLLERYNKCIASGGDYFEGDENFMSVLSIKVPIRKKTGNLFYDARFYLIDIIWLGWVLWHINDCRLFNTKSFLYIYIKYIWLVWLGFMAYPIMRNLFLYI